MTKQAFDHIAKGYDTDFTSSRIGQLQRERVYLQLTKLISSYPIKNVLELNCGTGADAIWLAQQSCDVLATDISATMIQVVQQKVASHQLEDQVSCQQLAVQDLHQLSNKTAYDLVFSNFGGLNCVDPTTLHKAIHECYRLLKPGGHLVAVLLSRWCWWEFSYFIAKANWQAATRRRSKGAVQAHLGDGIFVDTWYYSPKQFSSYLLPTFEVETISPVGFFIPPSIWINGSINDEDY